MIVRNCFKRHERFAFVVLLTLAACAGVLGAYCVLFGWSNGAKWLGTSGLLATITGVVQLEVSGLFNKLTEHYVDTKKYTYGPPSYVTREIIDVPGIPFVMWLRVICFFNVRTGFWLIVLGTITQIAAVWL